MLGDTYEITTAQQRSALLLAWSRCQVSTVPATPTEAPATTMIGDASSSTGSWSETFAPKLTAQVVSEMKQKFKKHYPAEVLLPENTPSLRLLSLIHHEKTKGDYKWVPWKYRLS